MTPNAPPSPALLDYGRSPRRLRWRRWMTYASIGVIGAISAYVGWRQLDVHLQRRAAIARVNAWYDAARTYVAPAGTLLYSEHAADLSANAAVVRRSRGSRSVAPHVMFNEGLPLPYKPWDLGGSREMLDNVIFVHERDWWHIADGIQPGTTQSAPKPGILCVAYLGTEAGGPPRFSSMFYRLVDADHVLPLGVEQFGAVATVRPAPTRSLANLRIYAGRSDPIDKTRFSLPFDSDGGRGRFEFRTDVDATDGGQMAPDVWIEWDDANLAPSPP